MGETPHGQPHNIRLAFSSLFFGLMTTRAVKPGPRFGGLIAGFYNAYGEPKARGVPGWQSTWSFIGPDRDVVNSATGKA
jgi:hypothetical protein